MNLYTGCDEVRKFDNETADARASDLEEIPFVAVERTADDANCTAAHGLGDLTGQEIFRILGRADCPDEAGHVILRDDKRFTIPPLLKRNCKVLILCTIGSINKSEA